MFQKILVPVDLTENELTRRALDAAETLAEQFGGEVRLVNVQSLVPVALLDYAPEDFGETLRHGLEQELAAVAASGRLPQDRTSTAVLFGPVYEKILQHAESWGADIILVGSHRPSAARFLIGSNASAIVRHASCSVLVIR